MDSMSEGVTIHPTFLTLAERASPFAGPPGCRLMAQRVFGAAYFLAEHTFTPVLEPQSHTALLTPSFKFTEEMGPK